MSTWRIMAEFRSLSPDFAVASRHLRAEDIARAAAEGFKLIVCNRPDNEEPGQPSEAEIKAAATAAGLGFRSLPYKGQTPPGIVAETALMLDETNGPVLAYCRTGTRSTMAWALAQALSGTQPPDDIIASAAKAGYDLSGARGVIETLAPKT